jgi:hypothetical protein
MFLLPTVQKLTEEKVKLVRMFLSRGRARYKALCCSVIDIMYDRNCPRDIKTWQEFQRLRSYWPHLFQIKSTFTFVYGHSKNRLTECWTVHNNCRYWLTSFLRSKIRIMFYCAMLSCHLLIFRRFEFGGPRKGLPETWTWEGWNLSKRLNSFTSRRGILSQKKGILSYAAAKTPKLAKWNYLWQTTTCVW